MTGDGTTGGVDPLAGRTSAAGVESLSSAVQRRQPSFWKGSWEILLKTAAAAAGLTVFVYLIGALTVWLRLWAANFPTDVGVEHQSRAALVALGLRGVIVLAALTLLVAAIVTVAMAVEISHRSRRAWRNDAQERALGAVLGGLCVAFLFAAAFESWRAFAFAIWFTALSGVTVERMLREERGRWTIPSWVIVLTGVALGSASWQVEPPVRVQSVFVAPSPEWLPEHCSVPYFGETADFVYVAEVKNVVDVRGTCSWQTTGRIAELRRDAVTLRFDRRKSVLYKESDAAAPGRKIRALIERSLGTS